MTELCRSNINRDPSVRTLTWASAPCVCRAQIPAKRIASLRLVLHLGWACLAIRIRVRMNLTLSSLENWRSSSETKRSFSSQATVSWRRATFPISCAILATSRIIMCLSSGLRGSRGFWRRQPFPRRKTRLLQLNHLPLPFGMSMNLPTSMEFCSVDSQQSQVLPGLFLLCGMNANSVSDATADVIAQISTRNLTVLVTVTLAFALLRKAIAEENRQRAVQSETLLQTSSSWDGETYKSYPAGQPELSIPSISIAPSLSFLDGGSTFAVEGSLSRPLNCFRQANRKARDKTMCHSPLRKIHSQPRDSCEPSTSLCHLRSIFHRQAEPPFD